LPINVALIHMKLKPLARRLNLEKARKLIKEAALKGANVAILPAFVNVGAFYLHYPLQRVKTLTRNQAEKIPSSTTELLSATAIENGIYIIAGPIIERAGPKLFLTTLVFAPNGSLIGKYRKIAVNGLDTELGISPGRSLHIIDKLPRRFGLLAEDDIYYPELARSLIMLGATALIVSLRHGDDVERAKLMLLARSIENNVPILAVGGVFESTDKYVETPTMVIDPKRGVVEELRGENEVDTYILVQVSENPDNINDIIKTTVAAKNLSHLYCKAARESLYPYQHQKR